jgi:hypothetical protein
VARVRLQMLGGTASAHRVAGTTSGLVPDTPDDGCSLSLSQALVDATAGSSTSSGEEGSSATCSSGISLDLSL